MKKFEHGGDINSFAKELKCDTNEIIDLSSNINFIKPKIQTDFNKLDISSYPSYKKLYKKIANKYKIKQAQIELFNGGSSAIFTLFKHLNLKNCTIYSPAYLEYKKAASLFSYNLEKINRFKSINKEVKKNSLVIFVNPSTPDGKYYDLDNLMKYWISRNCTIFVDESFLEFTKNKSAVKYLNSYDKLYILKSMTKFYSSAGIRVGTIISSKENIKRLKEKEPMWKLSTFDMNYLLEALKDKKLFTETYEKTTKNRNFLIKNIKKFDFVEKVYRSDSNFLLIKLKNKTANELQEHLKNYRIMIRNCSNFDFLNKYHVRIAIKKKKNLKLFINALKEF